MKRFEIARLKTHAEIFKALSHPSRLLIVEALANGERCVNDLTALIGVDMSTVSRHLAILRNVGIIKDDKRGLQVFYQLRCKCILKFLDCVESVTKERAATADCC